MKTLDDLAPEVYDKVEAAIKKFRNKKNRTRTDEHVLYDALTNAGLSSEYADEFINMEMDGGDSAW